MAAKVKVTNRLPGERGQSLRVVLSQVDVPDGPILQFPYSPHEISITPNPVWSERKAAGAVVSRMDWTGNGSSKVNINTRQKAFPGETERLENLLATLTAWATLPTDLTQMPTRVAMSWGDFLYTGVLKNLVIKKEVVDDRGNSLVAAVSFTLMESI